jgi:hypothetical protein
MIRDIRSLVGILLAAPCMAGEPAITALKDPTGKLLLQDAFVVSADGAFVAGTASIPDKTGRYAYRWSRDGVHLIGDLPGGEANPHFPALRSDPLALSGASRRKQTPSSNPVSTNMTSTLTSHSE